MTRKQMISDEQIRSIEEVIKADPEYPAMIRKSMVRLAAVETVASMTREQRAQLREDPNFKEELRAALVESLAYWDVEHRMNVRPTPVSDRACRDAVSPGVQARHRAEIDDVLGFSG